MGFIKKAGHTLKSRLGLVPLILLQILNSVYSHPSFAHHRTTTTPTPLQFLFLSSWRIKLTTCSPQPAFSTHEMWVGVFPWHALIMLMRGTSCPLWQRSGIILQSCIHVESILSTCNKWHHLFERCHWVAAGGLSLNPIQRLCICQVHVHVYLYICTSLQKVYCHLKIDLYIDR